MGRTVDVGVTDRAVRVMDGGEVVAVHDRLRGRKGQYSTNDEHMPQAHRDARSPWSRERFESWADRIAALPPASALPLRALFLSIVFMAL